MSKNIIKPHNTHLGYCCACGYDIAGFEEALAKQKEELIDKFKEIIDYQRVYVENECAISENCHPTDCAHRTIEKHLKYVLKELDKPTNTKN